MDLGHVPGWTLQPTEITQLPPTYTSELFSRLSCPVVTNATPDTPETTHQLQLLHSAALQPPLAHNSENTTIEPPEYSIDTIFFTGGLTWSMDRLPETPPPTDPPSLAAATDILAICVHPHGSKRNKAGKEVQGPGLIQIWAIPNTARSPWCPDGTPRYLLGCAHSGRVTWDAKWCPDPTHHFSPRPPPPTSTSTPAPTTPLPTLGILAAVLGDGSIQIFSVPRPSSAHPRPTANPSPPSPKRHRTNSSHRPQDLHPGVSSAPPPIGSACSIRPHVTVTKQQLAGSVASCVAWQSAPPHDHLVVGCWDGMVVLLKLPPAAGGPCQGVALFRGDDEAIRAVAWCPPPPEPTLDRLERHLMVTSGSSGRVKIWDTRDLQLPAMEKLMHRCQVLEVAWLGGVRGSLLCAMEDGVLRGIPMDSKCLGNNKETAYISKGDNTGCLWSVSTCREVGLAAYSGEDGVVAMSLVESEPDVRRRKPHIPIGGFEAAAGRLRVVNPLEPSPDNRGCYLGGSWFVGSKDRKGVQKLPRWPEDLQTVYCVRFGGVVEGSAWVAYGGAAGVVRVQRVALRVLGRQGKRRRGAGGGD